MKKWYYYLSLSLFAITLFLGYSSGVKALNKNDVETATTAQFYDVVSSSSYSEVSTYSQYVSAYDFNMFTTDNLTLTANSYGGLLSFKLNNALVANNMYSITIYLRCGSDSYYCTKSTYNPNRISLGSSVSNAASNFFNNINSVNAEFVNFPSTTYPFYYDASTTNKTSAISYIFKAPISSSYLSFIFTASTTNSYAKDFLGYTIENLGSADNLSEEQVDSIISEQTTEINNNLTNMQSALSSNIDEMEESINGTINDNFNSCEPSKNLFNINATHTTVSGGSYKYDFYLKPNTQYTLSSNSPQTSPASLYLNGGNSSTNNVYNNFSRTVTTDEDGYLFVYVRYTPSSDGNSIDLYSSVVDGTYYIQLEEGSVATSYEAYGEEVCSNKIDETNDKLDEANKTSKGIWETLKSIPQLILDGIKGLFVPSQEELQSLIEEFKETMESKLGAIYQITDMLIDIFKSIFTPTERNSCLTFPEIKDPMFDKLIVEQTDYCFDSLRTDFEFLFTISDMIISIVCTLAFGNMLYKKFEGFIGGDTSDY